MDGRGRTRCCVDGDLPAKLDPRALRSDGVFHLQSTVVLPPELRERPLLLAIPRLDARATVWADGVVAQARRFEPSSTYRLGGPHLWALPVEASRDGELRIELEIVHSWTQAAWLHTLPRIVPAGSVDVQTRFTLLINQYAALAGAMGLALVGLIYLFVFVTDRSQHTHLYFAIQGLVASYYPLHVSGFTQVLNGSYDGLMVALTLETALLSSLYFFHAQFKIGRPPRFWLIVSALGIAVTPAFPGPFDVTRVGAVIVVSMLASVVVYILGRSFWMMWRGRGSWSLTIFVTAWLVLGLTAVPDGWAWLGWGELVGGARPAAVGLIVFATLQALILAIEHTDILRSRESLNRELARRVVQLERQQAEVQGLNAELRRQIAGRSRQLFEALGIVTGKFESPPPIGQGEVIQGRYRVLEQVGSGAMGAVYRVERISDNRILALKQATALDRDAFLRFAREAEIAARLNHPNVVEIVDVDFSPRGYAFLVLEWIDGVSVDALRDRYGDARWAVAVLAGVARALEAVHAKGIVHRDVKPANVLTVTGGGAFQVKLADFGVSRLETEEGVVLEPQAERSLARPPSEVEPTFDPAFDLAPEDSTLRLAGSAIDLPAEGLTMSGTLLGTPRFVAPELAFGGTGATPAADVWSFGIMAYLLLYGDYPYQELPIASIRAGRSTSISAFRPIRGVPSDVLALLQRCLGVDASARPTAAALAVALEAVNLGKPVSLQAARSRLDATAPPIDPEAETKREAMP